MLLSLGEFYSLACTVVWAAAVILFRKSGEQLAPEPLALLKNAIGLLLMAVTVLVWHGGDWPAITGRALPLLLLSGLLGIALGDTLYLRALNLAGAAPVAVAQTLYSPFVILMSLAFLGERLGPWQWAGVALVLLGILAVGYHGAPHLPRRQLAAGMAYGVVAVLAMAAGIVIAKPWLAHFDFLTMVALRLLGGVLGLLAALLLHPQRAALLRSYARVHDWRPILAAAVLGTYLSMMLWLAGYKYAPASVSAVLNEAAGAFIVLFAVVFLHERLSRRQLGGAAVALAGVLLVVLG